VSILFGTSATIGNHADVAQLVERDLAKVEVAGSSPVVRSNQTSVRTSVLRRTVMSGSVNYGSSVVVVDVAGTEVVVVVGCAVAIKLLTNASPHALFVPTPT
jgi:hypothetical protein